MDLTRPLPVMDADFKVAVTIPLLTIGTIGNFLTLCVLQRSAFTNKTFAVFLRSLAVADCLTLWCGKATAEALVGGHIINYSSEWLKRLHLGPWIVVAMVSSWTLVLISVERLIIVYMPHRAQVLCTMKSACTAVAVVWMFLSLCMLIFCIASSRPFSLGVKQLLYYGVLYLYIPGSIMVTCNILISVRLHKATLERKAMGAGALNTESHKITVMLVTNSFAFIILTLPHLLLMTIWPFVPNSRNLALYSFLYTLGRLNHAINFLLYCLSGSMFRRETKHMLLSLADGFLSIARCTKPRKLNSDSSSSQIPAISKEQGASSSLDMQSSDLSTESANAGELVVGDIKV